MMRPVIFRQITHDDLGCASYFVGDYSAGVAAVRRSPLRDRGVPRARALSRRRDRPRARDPQPRRPRLGARPAGGRHRRDDPRQPARGTRDTSTRPSRTASSSSSARSSCARSTPPATAPSTRPSRLSTAARGDEPWAVLTGDSLFVGDVARPDLAIEREQGAREIFHSLHERLLALAARDRGLARPSRRLALRRARDGHEGVVDDRLRAPPQRPARAARRGRVRRAHAREPRPAAAQLPGGRRPEPRPARDRGRRAAAAHAAPGRAAPRGGRADRRRAHRHPVRRGAHSRRAVSITMLRQGFGTKLSWVADREQEIVLDRARRRGRARGRTARHGGGGPPTRRLPRPAA